MPTQVRIYYDPLTELGGLTASQLSGIYYWDGAEWTLYDSTGVEENFDYELYSGLYYWNCEAKDIKENLGTAPYDYTVIASPYFTHALSRALNATNITPYP